MAGAAGESHTRRRHKQMKLLAQITLAAFLAAGMGFAQSSGAKEDLKDAGAAAKDSGKAAGRATKKAGKGVYKGAKKGVSKAAEKTAEGADKVADKTR